MLIDIRELEADTLRLGRSQEAVHSIRLRCRAADCPKLRDSRDFDAQHLRVQRPQVYEHRARRFACGRQPGTSVSAVGTAVIHPTLTGAMRNTGKIMNKRLL